MPIDLENEEERPSFICGLSSIYLNLSNPGFYLLNFVVIRFFLVLSVMAI